MAYNLHDRHVLVTGASSGIGRATSAAFCGAGARVSALARSEDKLNALAAELGRDRVNPVVCDVTDADQRDVALSHARAAFGPIDVLINNAGWASFSSVTQTPGEHVERLLALNVAAPIYFIQAIAPEMVDRGSGQIVNISSVVGNQPIPGMSIYSATKAAVSSLSAGLRMELRGTGVDVILVAPGSTRSEFFDAAGRVDVQAVRFAKTQYSPERVARAVVRSCRKRRREITLTADGKTITIIRRMSHRLADFIMYHVGKHSMKRS